MPYIADSIIHGRGVFAEDYYYQGEVVETCVAIPFEYHECPADFPGLMWLEQPIVPVPDGLANYQLYWTDTHDAVATGCALMYNHSDDPNVEFVNDYEKNLIYVKALRFIQKDDELVKKYKCGKWW